MKISLLKSIAHYAVDVSAIDRYVKESPRDRGLLETAIVNLSHSVRLDPQFSYAHYRLARAHMRNDAADNALKHYARAVALKDPSTSDVEEELRCIYPALRGSNKELDDLIQEEGKAIDRETKRLQEERHRRNREGASASEPPGLVREE